MTSLGGMSSDCGFGFVAMISGGVELPLPSVADRHPDARPFRKRARNNLLDSW